MRIALLALPETGGEPVLLAGQPVVLHQLHAAIGVGCERIVCLANAPGPLLAALQRETERAGARFHAVSQARALSGLVHAADTLLVFAPGVLPDRDWLQQTLGGRAGVAILPAERGVAQGYERIDRERAWGGVLATRGDAVETLGDLPPDADPAAGLLRVALQRGARPVEVPESWLDDGRWAFLPDRQAADRHEPLWYARRVPPPGFARPSDALVHLAARKLAGRAALGPPWPLALGIAGAVFALGGGVAGYLGQTVAGLALIVGGILSGGIGAALDRFVRVGSGTEPRRWPREARDALVDLALIATAASPSEFAGWPTPFAAMVLVATIRLAREPDANRFERPIGDRALVFAVLAAFAAADQFPLAMAAIALIALAIRLFAPKSRG